MNFVYYPQPPYALCKVTNFPKFIEWISTSIILNEICQCGCQGTCRIEESYNFDLNSLIMYEKELEKELNKYYYFYY